MIRRPPRSTLDRSSAASDVYKRQIEYEPGLLKDYPNFFEKIIPKNQNYHHDDTWHDAVSYTHLRAHETVLDLVCRLLLEKKKNTR